MNEDYIKKIAMDVYDEKMKNSQYDVAYIPYHTHNGIDSVQIAGASGSATPGGSDTNIQFNDSGNLGGDSLLTFDKNAGGLLLLSTHAGTGAGSGGDINLTGGDGGTTGGGGSIISQAGTDGFGGTGGAVAVFGGTSGGGGDGSGGGINIVGGSAAGGTSTIGGPISIASGSGAGNNRGGQVDILAGSAGAGTISGATANLRGGAGGETAGAGGIATVKGGSAVGSDSNGGDVQIQGGGKTGTGHKGNVDLSQSLATTDNGGFVLIPHCAGTPTGTPAQYAMVYDVTNFKLYMYTTASGWVSVGLFNNKFQLPVGTNLYP